MGLIQLTLVFGLVALRVEDWVNRVSNCRLDALVILHPDVRPVVRADIPVRASRNLFLGREIHRRLKNLYRAWIRSAKAPKHAFTREGPSIGRDVVAAAARQLSGVCLVLHGVVKIEHSLSGCRQSASRRTQWSGTRYCRPIQSSQRKALAIVRN